MILYCAPVGLYPERAYDGEETFYGILQSYFTVVDATGQNIGISRRWNDTTAAQYVRDFNNRLLPTIHRLFGPEKPMHTYSAEDFELILSELKKNHHYAQDSVRHYRHLIRLTYYAGVDGGKYADQLFWEEILDDLNDPEQFEKHRIAAMTRTRKSFSVREDIRMLRYFLSLDPITATGEDIGLMLMYFLGIRNNESCGSDYGAIRLMTTHPENAVYDMLQTTKIGSNELKSGGKTGNAPRTLPLYRWVFDFLEKRKIWIENEVKNGTLRLPDGIQSLDQLPVVCKGNDLVRRAHTTDLSRSGRTLFQTIGISRSELAVLQQILFSEEFRETQIDEKDPTTYLLRRNVATRLYTLGFEWTKIQYWIAHEIEDSLLQRNFFADEETLYELAVAYERHPIFSIMRAVCEGKTNAEQKESLGQRLTKDEQKETCYLIRAKALEPGSAVSVSIHSSEPVRIVRTDMACAEESLSTVVDIRSPLHRAYWKCYKEIADL